MRVEADKVSFAEINDIAAALTCPQLQTDSVCFLRHTLGC